MFSEDDLIPISALQHAEFCERQLALEYVEGIWKDNALTIDGSYFHKNIDEEGERNRRGTRIITGVLLRSLQFGIYGKADLVEKREEEGKTLIYPVEYKRGKPKKGYCDVVQVCAQALCLEEMLSVSIPYGFLFYGKTQHRVKVSFDNSIRNLTKDTIEKVRRIISAGETPKAKYGKWCKNCSLHEKCVPELTGKSALLYFEKMIGGEP